MKKKCKREKDKYKNTHDYDIFFFFCYVNLVNGNVKDKKIQMKNEKREK